MKMKTFWLVTAFLAMPLAAFAQQAPEAGHGAHQMHGVRK
jgi:hypothetical protein